MLPKFNGTPQARYQVTALANTTMASLYPSEIIAADVQAYRDQLAIVGKGGSRRRSRAVCTCGTPRLQTTVARRSPLKRVP